MVSPPNAPNIATFSVPRKIKQKYMAAPSAVPEQVNILIPEVQRLVDMGVTLDLLMYTPIEILLKMMPDGAPPGDMAKVTGFLD